MNDSGPTAGDYIVAVLVTLIAVMVLYGAIATAVSVINLF
jgi:hypothetical protein